MRAAIKDAELLANVNPLDVAAYLRADGWRILETKPQRAAIWGKKVGSDAVEVLLPLDRSLRDFAIRMGDVLATLESTEERSQLQIFGDLQTASADVIRLRVSDDDAADGTLPIEEGVALVSKARDLMVAAACAAVKPRARYHSRRFDKANDYVDGLRLGQTERGSYVISVISRVTPSMTPPAGSIDHPPVIDEPFERQAVTTLTRAVSAASIAASDAAVTQDFARFNEVVDDGVSANLCDALVGLVGDPHERQRTLELSVSWSRSRPLQSIGGLTPPSRVKLSADVMPVLFEASRWFKEIAPLEDFDLVGQVIGTHRHHEQAGPGRITVEAVVEDRIRNVTIELNEQDYAVALEAHRDRKPVSCTGEIVKTVRSLRLNNPRGFALYSKEDGSPES
jgi:hypothetical protein